MLHRRADVLCLILTATLGGMASAQEPVTSRWTSAKLPLDSMTPVVREKVRLVVDRPTLCSSGPTETFACNPAVYGWYLDHPDRAVAAWRRLGAKVVDISDRGNGRFGWSDGQGSDVVWETALRTETMRIWYAEGKVKPGPLVAAIPFEAVLVLRHQAGQDAVGRNVVRHQADLVLHTDSKSAVLVAKLLGSAGPRMAEQYVAQVEMFLSALPWYIEQHPERAQELLSAVPTPAPVEAAEPRRRAGLLRRESAKPE